MTANESYADIQRQIRELKAKATAMRQEVFHTKSKKFFEANPNLVSFSWTQYTPYFNDGDECVFSARTDYLQMTFLNTDGEEVEVEEVSKWVFGGGIEWLEDVVKSSPQNTETAKAILEFMHQFDDDDLHDTFGNHVRVTVTKNGAETDEYSHD